MSPTRYRWTGALLTALLLTSAALSEDSVRLRETFAPGGQYRVSTRVELSGSLTVPPEMGKTSKPIAVNGESAIDYDERILDVGQDGGVKRAVRLYRKIDLQRKIGQRDQKTTLRPEVRRLVLVRKPDAKMCFSPDGPLIWNEIDLVRADVFIPALTGLLPEQAVKPGDRWKGNLAAMQELTDLEGISDDSKIDLRLDQVTTINGRRYARVELTGVVKGTNEDGLNRQHLDAYFLFDLESQHLAFLSLNGKTVMLDPEGKEVGRIEGRYTLTRTLQSVRDLGDEALRGVVLEPNMDNTRLLYDNPDLGVRFQHPRRWRMGLVKGKQITLDGPEGCGLLVSLEPLGKLPTAAQFQSEAQGFLKDQKDVKLVKTEPPQRVTADLEKFALELEAKGNKVRMEYFILKQARGGVTFAARVQGNDAALFEKEVDAVLRSLTLTKTVEETVPPKP
jgi:hypothetical protein